MGALNEEQCERLAPFVKGKVVLDLGAGDLSLSRVLVQMGAKVVAVDKEDPGVVVPGVRFVRSYFHDLRERAPVAFVSWPVNWHSDIVPILVASTTVIYLGKNTDGTACGDPNLWEHLRAREVLAYVPDRRNTMAIYGPNFVERDPTGEELASASVLKSMSYEEAEGYSPP